jgi:transposase
VHRRGRKRAVAGDKEAALCEHLKKHPDATVLERRKALGLKCSEKTLWQTLRRLGWRYKKSRRVPWNRTVKMSP